MFYEVVQLSGHRDPSKVTRRHLPAYAGTTWRSSGITRNGANYWKLVYTNSPPLLFLEGYSPIFCQFRLHQKRHVGHIFLSIFGQTSYWRHTFVSGPWQLSNIIHSQQGELFNYLLLIISLFPVCVCVCARARSCVCACVCVYYEELHNWVSFLYHISYN